MIKESVHLALIPFRQNEKMKINHHISIFHLGYKYLRLSLGLLGKILVTIVYDILYSWTAETYPTFLR